MWHLIVMHKGYYPSAPLLVVTSTPRANMALFLSSSSASVAPRVNIGVSWETYGAPLSSPIMSRHSAIVPIEYALSVVVHCPFCKIRHNLKYSHSSSAFAVHS